MAGPTTATCGSFSGLAAAAWNGDLKGFHLKLLKVKSCSVVIKWRNKIITEKQKKKSVKSGNTDQ